MPHMRQAERALARQERRVGADPLAANAGGSPPSAPVQGSGALEHHRRIARDLLRLKIWERVVWMRMVDVQPAARWGWATGWLHRRMCREQIVDKLHHSPCCPANHYHRKRLVLLGCICGAEVDKRDPGGA